LVRGKEAIEKSRVFIAVVTPKSIGDDGFFEACLYANRIGKLMYAVVKRGVKWDRFMGFNWRKVYLFSDSDEFSDIMSDIKRDTMFYNSVRDI